MFEIVFGRLSAFFLRWRYPVSTPQEVFKALGMDLPTPTDFQEFIQQLDFSHKQIKNFFRFMPREEAEAYFSSAVKKERFRHQSLYSYCFKSTQKDCWVEFILDFDQHSRLRRMYLEHKEMGAKRLEIHLASLS